MAQLRLTELSKYTDMQGRLYCDTTPEALKELIADLELSITTAKYILDPDKHPAPEDFNASDIYVGRGTKPRNV